MLLIREQLLLEMMLSLWRKLDELKIDIVSFLPNCFKTLNVSPKCVMLYRAYRTAICKSKRGGFKDTLPDDLLAPVLKVCYKAIFHTDEDIFHTVEKS